jgi:uncharacterized protein (DUF1778 family)
MLVSAMKEASVRPASSSVSAAKDRRLNLRVSAEAKSLVEQAARATHMTASAFVLQAALRSAQDVLADQTRFVLDPERWAEFTAMMDRPAREIGALKQAAARPSPFSER